MKSHLNQSKSHFCAPPALSRIVVFVIGLLVSVSALAPPYPTSRRTTLSTLSSSTSDDISVSDVPSDLELHDQQTRDQLKRSVLQLGASYDRGFGATPRVQDKMSTILQDLESFNPESNASRGIDGPTETDAGVTSPLEGNWRMIWTTAQDVLVLGANPFVSVGAIYQFIEPPVITNVIDFLPRIQNLLPLRLIPASLLRAEVLTRASSRTSEPEAFNRIGLTFEKVSFNAREFLGQDVSGVLPPLGLDLPRLPDGVGGSNAVGYFDVSYLDSDLLVIRQNAPGGCFVLVKVEDTDP